MLFRLKCYQFESIRLCSSVNCIDFMHGVEQLTIHSVWQSRGSKLVLLLLWLLLLLLLLVGSPATAVSTRGGAAGA